MKTTFTFIFALFMLIGFSAFSQNEGSAAPDFTLSQLGGGDFKLSDQSGKVVFIFWIGHNCSLCRSVAPSIRSEIVDAFKDNQDFVAIAIDAWNGSTTQVDAFKSQTGLNVNYLLSGSSIASNYGTSNDRLSVIDKKGVLVHKGTTAASNDINKTKDAITAALQEVVTNVPELIENLTVFKNYPNPFSDQTTIQFEVGNSSLVNLNVYDISGKKVREITNKEYSPGSYQISFSKGSLGKGLYFLRLRNDNFVTARKIIIQ